MIGTESGETGTADARTVTVGTMMTTRESGAEIGTDNKIDRHPDTTEVDLGTEEHPQSQLARLLMEVETWDSALPA